MNLLSGRVFSGDRAPMVSMPLPPKKYNLKREIILSVLSYSFDFVFSLIAMSVKLKKKSIEKQSQIVPKINMELVFGGSVALQCKVFHY